MDDVVLFEEDLQRIHLILMHLLKESEALFALLVNKDGHLLAQEGLTATMDTTALAALAAGSFASTKALANLLGESEFSVMFHQGKQENIHISLVGENTIMLLIFDDRTNIGLIRLCAKNYVKELLEIFNSLEARKLEIKSEPPLQVAPETKPAELENNIDRLFT